MFIHQLREALNRTQCIGCTACDLEHLPTLAVSIKCRNQCGPERNKAGTHMPQALQSRRQSVTASLKNEFDSHCVSSISLLFAQSKSNVLRLCLLLQSGQLQAGTVPLLQTTHFQP